MKAGASCFLLKDATRDKLANAVRTVANGESLLAAAMTRRLLEDSRRTPAAISAGSSPRRRGPQSRDEFYDARLRGLSNAETAVELFSANNAGTSHPAYILNKWDLRYCVQAVRSLLYQLWVRSGSSSISATWPDLSEESMSGAGRGGGGAEIDFARHHRLCMTANAPARRDRGR